MADNLYAGGKYHLRERQEGYMADELLTYYKKIQQTYQVLCMQNPFVESDKKLAAAMMADLGQTIKIAGIIPINQLHKLIAQNIYNSIIIQANHFSSVTELTMYINQLRQHGLPFIFSQAFEETNDDLIADIAVGLGADYVQFGPTNRGERVAKYNRLLMIETELGRSSN
jgi:enolase